MVHLLTLCALWVSAVFATTLPVVMHTSTKWYNNFLGRYLMFQSLAFAVILDYIGYSALAKLTYLPPLPATMAVGLGVYSLLAVVKGFGVFTFLRARYLKRKTQ